MTYTVFKQNEKWCIKDGHNFLGSFDNKQQAIKTARAFAGRSGDVRIEDGNTTE